MLSVVPGRASAIFNLEYPQSVVVVDDYATAQKLSTSCPIRNFRSKISASSGQTSKRWSALPDVARGARCSAKGRCQDSGWAFSSAS
jgi:hypothetical protein